MPTRLKFRLDEKAQIALARNSIIYLFKVIAVLSLLIGGMGVVMLIAGYDTAVSVTVTVAGFLVPAFMIVIIYFWLPRKIKKMPETKRNTELEFVFGDKITVSEISDICEVKDAEYLWQAFFRAAETEDYFFLYLNKFSALIIDKNGFTEGNSDDLRAEFIKQFGKKFSATKKLKKTAQNN